MSMEKTTTSLRAGIYSRVSTDEQAHEGYSPAEQECRALELIERERWQYVKTYQGAGFSGSDLNRPAYRQLLDDVAAGTSVHHNAGCRCLREHGPYKVRSAREIKGLRACRYCGGGK